MCVFLALSLHLGVWWGRIKGFCFNQRRGLLVEVLHSCPFAAGILPGELLGGKGYARWGQGFLTGRITIDEALRFESLEGFCLSSHRHKETREIPKVKIAVQIKVKQQPFAEIKRAIGKTQTRVCMPSTED